MKHLVFAIVFLTLLLVFPPFADAKLLPQLKNSSSSKTVSTVSSGIGIFPRLRADRRAIIMAFTNLQNATRVSFTLTYLTNSIQEGAGGSITDMSQTTTTRELLFGTCSKNDCRYHTNISNAKLEVVYQTPSGKKYLRRFRIKV